MEVLEHLANRFLESFGIKLYQELRASNYFTNESLIVATLNGMKAWKYVTFIFSKIY